MLSCQFEPHHRVALVRYSGRVTEEDFAEHDRIGLALREHEGEVRVIVDLTGVTEIPVPTERFVTMARRPPIMGEQPRIYIVSGTEAFGLARLYAANQSATGTRQPLLVKTREEAFAEFGLDDPAFQPFP